MTVASDARSPVRHPDKFFVGSEWVTPSSHARIEVIDSNDERVWSGTVGHDGYRADFGIAFGGFKQSGIGRERHREGRLPYLETKVVVLDEAPEVQDMTWQLQRGPASMT